MGRERGERRSFLTDASSVLGSNVVVLALSIIIGIIISRELGPDGKGVYTAILIYPTLLIGLAELGIRQATVYHLGAKSLTDESIVSAMGFLSALSSVLCVSICGGLYVLLRNPAFTLPMIILALGTIPLHLAVTYSKGLFLGKGDVSGFNKTLWLAEVVRFLGIAVLVAGLKLGIIGALIATVLSSLVTAVYVVIAVVRSFRFSLHGVRSAVKALVGSGFIYALALFINSLNYRFDIVMMERLTTARELGIYSVGVSITELMWQIPSAIGTVVFFRSASAGQPVEFSRQVMKLLRISLLVIMALAALLLLLSNKLVAIVYGSQFLHSADVIRLLMPGVVFLTIFKVLNMDLAGRGKPLAALSVMVPGLVLNLVANYLLIPRYGASGAAVSSSISYGLSAIGFVFVYTRCVGLPVHELLRYRRSDFDFLHRLMSRAKRN